LAFIKIFDQIVKANSFNSFLALATCLLMVLSYSAEFRLSLGGLLVHPYLLFILLVSILFLIPIFAIDRKVLFSILTFFLLFGLLALQNQNPFMEPLKVGAAMFTFMFIFQTLKQEEDVNFVSLGLIAVSVFISSRIIMMGEDSESRLAGINVLKDLGNKNAQSLYTLPGFFFIVLHIIQSKKVSSKVIWIGLGVVVVLATALSANRSGWLGIVFIILFGLVHSWRHYSRGYVFPFLVLGLLSFWLIRNYAEDVVERKVAVTQEGYISDYGRELLLFHSLQVGMENPFIGVGKDELHKEMAKRLVVSKLKVDTHNLYGYLMGSSGIFTFISFFVILYLVQRPVLHLKSEQREILLWFIFLFLIRALFTREILYSPTFFAGLALVYGGFKIEQKAKIIALIGER